jgi:hypothetical protein
MMTATLSSATDPMRRPIPKGHRTMLAIHDPFTQQMRNRLKSTAVGLALVRLLQDARRFEEARTTLYSLENGFQGIEEESDKPSQKPYKGERIERHEFVH